MRCPQCQHENSAAAKFCEECGSRLVRRCPGCGQEVSPRAKFCPECGTPLSGLPAPAPGTVAARPQTPVSYIPRHLAEKILTSRGALEGERKQVTVLFADLKGSMELLADLDPEEARQIIDPALQLMMDAVHRYEGTVNQVMGDGIFALFGAPITHEDHAHRALFSALRMQQEIRRYGDQLRVERGAHLEIRVGLNTGEVVVGSICTYDLHTDYVPIGHSTSLAAPDTVVISPATARLVQGYFECRPLGAHLLKGIPQPVAVSQVLWESGAQTRLEVAVATGLTPLVGREAEWEVLRARWAQAKDGGGQGVLLSGEAGIGKSRLMHMLKEEVGHEPGAELTAYQCLAYYQHTPLYPLIDWLERGVLGVTREDLPQQKLRALEGWLEPLGFSLPDAVPLLAALLSIPLGEEYPPLPWTAAQQRHQTLQALLTAAKLDRG